MNLWGDDFVVPDNTKDILNKTKNVKTVKTKTVDQKLKSKTIPVSEKIVLITENVHKILGKFADDTVVIKTREQLTQYIDKAISNGVIAIDTETNNSLDPISCKLMGGCIYTPGEKNAYIPINHVDINTRERLAWQLTEQDIKEEFDRLGTTVIVMHNGKFDYEVLKCTCNCILHIDWDTLVGAKVLDENEPFVGLKSQYKDKIDSSAEKYDIEHLFNHMEYAIFDPELFALYAATDAFITYKLYVWQKTHFELPENTRIYDLFKDIEMPLVVVIAEMELAGMCIDQEYAQRLSKKYHKILSEIDAQIDTEMKNLKPTIDTWRLTAEANYRPPSDKARKKSKNEQLAFPVNFDSPIQLAILLYDVLKCPQVSRNKPRGTGEDILTEIYERTKLPILNAILERRSITKLVSTYIDVIPELARRWGDGRVRTHFNQYGAATGRLSSSDPLNFQNIPSHNKEIRLLFKARNGCKIVGGDFSAQEPRLTAQYAHDKNMIDAYIQGKDLYAVIASKSFGYPYEDCLEFYPEGTEILFEGKPVICGKKTHTNEEGKTRRGMAKTILLGILYGRGAKSVGEQINKSKEEAQEIINSFYNAFPDVKRWINETMENAHKNGYVEDVAGRRRRLPDILLSKYEFEEINKKVSFNPILFTCGKLNYIDGTVIDKYKRLLSNAKYRQDVDKVKKLAEAENIHIKDNSADIALAERQAVNARVQGGAATLTKWALLAIYNNQELKDLGAKLINAVHDEILLEVPEENSTRCAELLSSIMVGSAKKYAPDVPMSVDTYCVDTWYEDEYATLVTKEFKKLLDSGLTTDEAFDKICNNRCEMTRDKLSQICLGQEGK